MTVNKKMLLFVDDQDIRHVHFYQQIERPLEDNLICHHSMGIRDNSSYPDSSFDMGGLDAYDIMSLIRHPDNVYDIIVMDVNLQRHGDMDGGWGIVKDLARHYAGTSRSWPYLIVFTRFASGMIEQIDSTTQNWQSKFDFIPFGLKDSAPEHWIKLREHIEGYILNQAEGIVWLKLDETGPAATLEYNPSSRLNIITGDNGLGKTFILDCAWWAMTQEWLGEPALPRKEFTKVPRIVFSIRVQNNRIVDSLVNYNWTSQSWHKTALRDFRSGLLIYARIDGSFAVGDETRLGSREDDKRSCVKLTRDQVWDGLEAFSNDRGGDRNNAEPSNSPGKAWICNGLLTDWVTWKNDKQFIAYFEALETCLRGLSPPNTEPLTSGDPMRVPSNSKLIPTLKMPYGEIPVTHASAGIKRILSLAYILVWTWHEHRVYCEEARRDPQTSLILMMDEVEAHLHPGWQRSIIPALMEAVKALAPDLKVQYHLATHSPLVLASMETVFKHDTDRLHHLKLDGSEVVLEELPFVKRGRADLWLMSDVFGLGQPRSVEGEKAIMDAKQLQENNDPQDKDVIEVNGRLIRYLAADDDFWPRWRYFARQHGVPK